MYETGSVIDYGYVANNWMNEVSAIVVGDSPLLAPVLLFVATIIVWGVLKKWIFGGTSRI